jgi:hypothetical protein
MFFIGAYGEFTLTKWFKLSRAEVMAGTIQFCKLKGIELHFKKSPPANTDR